MRRPGRGQPGPHERRPAVGSRLPHPVVVVVRRRPGRVESAVVGDEPGVARSLDDERGQVERGVDPRRERLEVAHGQTARAQHPGRLLAPGGDKLSVANVVNGSLGDQGFFDDAERGIQELAKAGHKTTTLQADANNPSQWKANLESVSGGQWDLVVLGSAQMTDFLKEAVQKFPKQKYLFYDNVFENPNVASLVYKQNEGSFLAGVLAGLVTTSKADFPMSGEGKKVGAVGGMDIPVINDFMAGYKAAAGFAIETLNKAPRTIPEGVRAP